MRAFQAKISSLPDANVPDEYMPLKGRIPSDDFVVSRKKDGSSLSLYGDSSWDWTPYAADNRTINFNFNFWSSGELTPQRDQLAREMRWLMFVLIYLRPGHGLSNKSLRGYLFSLTFIARFCELRSLSIYELLADPALLSESMEENGGYATLIIALIQLLKHLGTDVVGFDVVSNKGMQNLQRIAIKYAHKLKQHPPIPTRLYSSMLSTLSEELAQFKAVADRILNLLLECANDPLTGKHHSKQLQRRRERGLGKQTWRPSFGDLLRKYDLEDYWTECGYTRSIIGLEAAVTGAMVAAAIAIQAFTGMRANEVGTLPFYCLDEVKRDEDDSIHYIVKGRITKHAHGRIKRVQWVTSESGRTAIQLAQRISLTIHKALGNMPEENNTRINSFHLFITPRYLFRPNQIQYAPARVLLECSPALRTRLQFNIQEEDLLELEQIDPHRAWRSEEAFQIGRPWTLTSHQLRRSLALYAQRSGLVTLPSLKRQLQHITQEMSLYYCRGSAFAVNFIGNQDKEPHFGKEWQVTQPVSQFLSYAMHVLITDETLFGVHPHWIKNRLRDAEGIVIFDRDVTLKRFQKGELAYRETILGGCVKIGDCDKNPLDILHVECLTTHCKNLVGNKKKLERVIAAQTHLVEKFNKADPVSTEYRHESLNLTILKTTLANISNGGVDSKENA